MSHECWNVIGVRGNGSCSELEQHIHCRNCHVYSAAAVALLDRESAAGDMAEWTTHFAKPKPTTERDTQSVVIFRIGMEWLALPTSAVKEITDLRPIHSLPHRRGGVVLGLANVRGELLICVSLARVLGLERAVPRVGPVVSDGSGKPLSLGGRERRAGSPLVDSPGTPPNVAHERLLVIRREQMRTVCPADEVHGIHRFHPRELKDVPATVAKATARHSKAVVPWRGHSVGLLDEQALFHTLQRSLG